MSYDNVDYQREAIYGVTAEFGTPEGLLHAAEKAYAEGYRDMDAYSPFPVHGLSEAIGFKKSAVAPITLAGGLAGALGGFLFQYWASGIAYPLNVGGRPYMSWPSFIPITFEMGVLAAAFSAVISMIVLNGLPRPHHPIFNAKNFERCSNDKFFLCIEATDEQFDTGKTQEFLNSLDPTGVSVVER